MAPEAHPAQAARAWLEAVSSVAREMVDIVEGLEQQADESRNLHTAMLEDMAEQMAEFAETATVADLRPALKRYARGLRSYLRRQRLESQASLKDLRCRAEELADRLERPPSIL
jgi:hypothetical protein